MWRSLGVDWFRRIDFMGENSHYIIHKQLDQAFFNQLSQQLTLWMITGKITARYDLVQPGYVR